MASHEMASATQKTPHEAAALIQARVRGHQHRSKQSRALKAITKLQARQRGRYTRREYQKLLEFYNEQESFLAESKRRQLRLWHREQELFFLQHTTAVELDRIRQFQYEKSARRIQREWKRLHPKPLEDVDVSGLGKPFDPFGLLGGSGGLAVSDRSLARESVMKELYGELPRSAPVSQDKEKMARRRAEIQDRLQRRRKEEEKQIKEKKPASRRELFNTLVELRQDTARRLQETSEKYGKSRGRKDLAAAQVTASCRNRLAFLQDEVRIQTLLNTSKKPAPQEQIANERHKFDADTATWGDDRKREAWESHSRILQCVLGKSKWYETYIAGEKQDIRHVYAESPWEHERKVWQWPPQTKTTDELPKDSGVEKPTPVAAIDRFMFGLADDGDENSPGNEDEIAGMERPVPMADELASSWWRTHATQSHFTYARLQQKQQQRERRRLAGNNFGTEDAQVTPEMLANPRFYELYKHSIAKNRQAELTQSVDARMSRLQRQIQQTVVEIETQIDVNTRVILEKASLAQQQQVRKTKEEHATIQIQRTVRGKLGRKRAQEHLAQYFVMVRGRAIRKGKCEECGEAQAVLECKQCEESLHFCPVCWVQVHSTRRRKTHVAIPMAVDVTARENKSSKVKTRGSWRVDMYPTTTHWPPMEGASSTTLDFAESQANAAARSVQTHADTATFTTSSALKQALAPVQATANPVTTKHQTTRPPNTSTMSVDATKAGVDTKPRARPAPNDSAPTTTAEVQLKPNPSAIQGDLSAPDDNEEKDATIALVGPAFSSGATSKHKHQNIMAKPPTSSAPANNEPPVVAPATGISKQESSGTIDEQKLGTLEETEASATSTLRSDAPAPLPSELTDDKSTVQKPAEEKPTANRPSSPDSTGGASDSPTVASAPTTEPKTQKPAAQPRARVTKAKGDAGATPRLSLRERLGKDQAKSTKQAVDAEETGDTTPKGDSLTDSGPRATFSVATTRDEAL